MSHTQKLRPHLERAERDRLALQARQWADALLTDAKRLEWGCPDRQQIERQAQSLKTFGKLIGGQ